MNAKPLPSGATASSMNPRKSLHNPQVTQNGHFESGSLGKLREHPPFPIVGYLDPLAGNCARVVRAFLPVRWRQARE
jgi:hypothetical protein